MLSKALFFLLISLSLFVSFVDFFVCLCVLNLGIPGKFQKSISVFLSGIVFQFDLGEDFSPSYS